MSDLQLTIEDLDLDLEVPRARGARPSALVQTFERDLTTEDIAVLIENPLRDVTTPSLQRLKTAHHQLARLLAEGKKDAEASLITGYSLARISILKSDPAFCELMAHYAGQVEEIFVNVHQRLATMGMMSLEELQDRLEDDPESFSNEDLRKLTETFFDRAGFGPKSTQVHEVGSSIGQLLDRVKDEVRKSQHGSIKTLDAQSRPAPSSSGGGSRLGLQIIESTGEHSDPSDSGGKSRGPAVREGGGENVIPLETRRES